MRQEALGKGSRPRLSQRGSGPGELGWSVAKRLRTGHTSSSVNHGIRSGEKRPQEDATAGRFRPEDARFSDMA